MKCEYCTYEFDEALGKYGCPNCEGDGLTYSQEVRSALGITQKELAEECGVSLKTVQDWDQGRRNPGGSAKKIMKLLIKSNQ